MMQQFQVGQDGLMSEVAASSQAEWYVSKCPELVDPVDFEAHIMLMRAYAALKTDAPFERKHGLTKARYNVLRLLHGAEDHRMPMTEIVTGMNVSPTNITKLVDGLEKDGYVRRAGYLGDKRKIWVELLPAGYNVVESTFPDVVRHVAALWRGLTEQEKRILIHLLAKLRLEILTESAEGHLAEVRQRPTPIALDV